MPVVHIIIGLTIIASIYVYWKKQELLQYKKIVVDLVNL